MFNLLSFKPEVCGHIVLPHRSILKGQKLSKNAKIKNSDAKIETFEKQMKMKKNCQMERNELAFYQTDGQTSEKNDEQPKFRHDWMVNVRK